MKLKAVGITEMGDIFAIRSADSARGMRFRKIYVGNGYRNWYGRNLETLVATLVARYIGDVVFLGDKL